MSSPKTTDSENDPELEMAADKKTLQLSGANNKVLENLEESSADGSESESEEEEEPRLKYERVRGDLSTLLERDSITAIDSNDKLVVIGTMGGGVVVLDHLGYQQQHRRPHVAPVLSVAVSGGYIASAGKDKRVVVQGLLSNEHNTVSALQSGAAVCVLLDPMFGVSRSSTRFVIGHSSGLTLYERGLLSGYRNGPLMDVADGDTHKGAGSLLCGGGAVRGAAWKGSLIAWATDSVVRVYHVGMRTTIALVQRDHSAALSSVQYPPCLSFHDDNTLLIGWADSIKVCRVKPRPTRCTDNPSKPNSRPSSSSVTPTATPPIEKRDGNSKQNKSSPLSSASHFSASLKDSSNVKASAVEDHSAELSQSTPSASHQGAIPNTEIASSILLSSSLIGYVGLYGQQAVSPPSVSDLPPLCMEIECMFSTDFFVCGLGMLEDLQNVTGTSSFTDNKLLVALTYNKTPGLEASRSSPTDTKGPQHFTDDPFEWRRPQLRLLEPQQCTYDEVSKDILGTNRYKDYLPCHYKLECVEGGDRWYILSPRDLVVARPREPTDSLLWLLDHHKYPQALNLLERAGGDLAGHSLDSVGRDYLRYLLDNHLYQQAAAVSKRVLPDTAKQDWIDLVKEFSAVNEVGLLYQYLPHGNPLPLPISVYEQILQHLLVRNHEALVHVLQTWPSACYDVNKLVGDVLQQLACVNWSVPLLQCLAHLYSHQQRHDKALAIYIKLQHTDIFGLIKKHGLYSCLSQYAEALMNLDSDITIELCMTHVDEAPPNDMVPALAGCSKHQFRYLSALYEHHKDLCRDYHDDLVVFMADNRQTDKLLNFLKTSRGYDLSHALQVCKSKGLLPHTVYLLDRTGNTQDALSLVLLEARDLQWAISLCEEHNDTVLWDTLIDHTIHCSDNVLVLLERAGKYIGPINIIQKIPTGLQVPGLLPVLSSILEDTKRQRSLSCGCERLLQRDIVVLTKRRRITATRAVAVNMDSTCTACGHHVLRDSTARGDASSKGELIVFKCEHVYHAACVPVLKPEDAVKLVESKEMMSVRRKRNKAILPDKLCNICQLKGTLFCDNSKRRDFLNVSEPK